MKKFILYLILTFGIFSTNAQSCQELMRSIKSESYGTTYNSYSSDAISKVTFYQVTIEYQTYYFAIVCFKKGYYGCDEYLYQVSSNTKYNYSYSYFQSAGKAFWKYIHPYNKNLGCAPKFE